MYLNVPASGFALTGLAQKRLEHSPRTNRNLLSNILPTVVIFAFTSAPLPTHQPTQLNMQVNTKEAAVQRLRQAKNKSLVQQIEFS